MINSNDLWCTRLINTPIHGATIQDSEAASGESDIICTTLHAYLHQTLTRLGLPTDEDENLWIPYCYEMSVRFKIPRTVDDTTLIEEACGHDEDVGTDTYFFHLTPEILEDIRGDFPEMDWEEDCHDKHLSIRLHLAEDF